MFQILLETVPYRQWIIVTPRASPPLLLYRIVKYEYSYCKVLYLPYYRIEPTTVQYLQYCGFHYLLPTLRVLPTTCYLIPPVYCLLPTTCYLLYLIIHTTCYLLPTTYYLLPTTYYLLPTTYLLPTAYCLLPATCYLLPTTYYLLPTTDYDTCYTYLLPTVPTTYYLLPTTFCTTVPTTSYLLPTTYYLLASTDRRRLQLGSWPSLLGRVPPLGLIYCTSARFHETFPCGCLYVCMSVTGRRSPKTRFPTLPQLVLVRVLVQYSIL